MSLDTADARLVAARPFHVARPVDEQASLFGAAAAVPWMVAGCAAATAAYVAIDDPGDGDGGLTACPIRALTGRWCPGCGLTRATHHLLRGNIVQAVSFNAALPVVLGGLVALWVTWLFVATGRGIPRAVRAIRPTAYAAAALVLAVFTVLRNFDGATILRGG